MYTSQQIPIVPIDIQQQEPEEDQSGKKRVRYLKQVYLLVILQQFVTIWILKLAQDHRNFREWILNNSGFTFWTCLILTIVIHLIGIVKRPLISGSLRWLVYLIHTAVISFLLAYLQSQYDHTTLYLYYTVKIFCFVVVALFLHAIWSNNRLTFQSASLYILGSVYLFTIWNEIFDQDHTLTFIYLVSFLATIWGFFLVWEQESIASVSNNQLGADQDFVSGAVLVYNHVQFLVFAFAENLRNLLIKARV